MTPYGAAAATRRAIAASPTSPGEASGAAHPHHETDQAAHALAERLAAERRLLAVRQEHALARRAQRVEHHRALADISVQRRRIQRDRALQRRDEHEQRRLRELYTKAARSGHRAYVRAAIYRSAEMRALRLARLQRAVIAVGLVVLASFGAWSTAGVQAGVSRLLDLAPGTPGWWAAWLVEPAIILVVGGLMVMRAILRTVGGDTDWRATAAEWTGLTASIALNVLGGWTGHGLPGALVEPLAHSIGAIGAAGAAWLIGVAVDYTTATDPWTGAPRVGELDVLRPRDLDAAVAEAEDRARRAEDAAAAAVAARTHAEAEAQAARAEAAALADKARAAAERAAAEAARARAAEVQATALRRDAGQREALLRAQVTAAESQSRAEAEAARRANVEAEAARAEAEAARAEAEAARAEAETARAEAEAARAEAEAARTEADKARAKAEAARAPRRSHAATSGSTPTPLVDGKPVPRVPGVGPTTVARVLIARRQRPDARQAELAAQLGVSTRTVRAVLSTAARTNAPARPPDPAELPSTDGTTATAALTEVTL